jgi:hypothetical protein
LLERAFCNSFVSSNLWTCSLEITQLYRTFSHEISVALTDDDAFGNFVFSQHGAPRVITLDGYAASHRAVTNLKESGRLPRRLRVRSCNYLNNVVEQDHRRIKQRVRPMLGFKRFETAAVTIRGIELAEKIKKQQFNLKPLTGKATTAPGIWTAVPAT